MREALHVLVAVHACKLHRAVDGVLELLAIHKQRNLLAIHVFGQGVVAVASEAIFVFQLVLGASGEGRAQQKEHERTEQDPAGNFHDYEETPVCDLIAVTRSHKVWRNDPPKRNAQPQNDPSL